MSATMPCPNPQRLHLLALGHSPAQERDAFAEYLEQCPEWAARMEVLIGHDPLVADLRAVVADDADVAVVAAVLQGQCQPLPVASAESATGFSTLGLDQAPAPLPATSGFAFLAPPQAADELGQLAHYRVLELLGTGGMGMVFRIDGTRGGLGGDPCPPGPIMLQNHGNPVQFRNIWLLPLKK